jgi:GNAT superfamily N-acetyltransferase
MTALTLRELIDDADVTAAFAIMRQLRPQWVSEAFVAAVRRQRTEGYRLLGGFAAGDRLVALAGFRDARTLSRGPHLFVDDLVTDESERGRGVGRAMIRLLAGHARDRGLPWIHLDSRSTAVGFYQQLGFAMLTAVPAKIAVAEAERL